MPGTGTWLVATRLRVRLRPRVEVAAVEQEREPQAGPREALRLISSRSFGPYFVGNAVSASGTWFQNLAAALLVYRQTHSAFLLGVLNFCQFVPVLLLVPWTGRAADRFDRRRLLLVTQPLAAALSGLLALLAWRGLASTEVVIADAAALGVCSAFSIDRAAGARDGPRPGPGHPVRGRPERDDVQHRARRRPGARHRHGRDARDPGGLRDQRRLVRPLRGDPALRPGAPAGARRPRLRPSARQPAAAAARAEARRPARDRRRSSERPPTP